ncbi:MAG: FAD-dependent oxidoreductase, partial [Candidatus Gastranaerophilaceae bacterium]
RIKGKYIYTINDLKSGKTFDNTCLVSDYPVDIHSNKKNKSVLEKQSQNYSLPIEALISADYDNLYIIGRGISADFQSQAALRIIPSCFSMGEGIAKYIAKLANFKK